MVLAFAVGGLVLAGAVALSPWHPGSADRGTVLEVQPPVR
jgi:hypothetical protein